MFFALTLAWSLGVRFAFVILIAHPALTRTLAGLTVVSVALALIKQWSAAPVLEAGTANQAEARSL